MTLLISILPSCNLKSVLKLSAQSWWVRRFQIINLVILKTLFTCRYRKKFVQYRRGYRVILTVNLSSRVTTEPASQLVITNHNKHSQLVIKNHINHTTQLHTIQSTRRKYQIIQIIEYWYLKQHRGNHTPDGPLNGVCFLFLISQIPQRGKSHTSRGAA